MPSWGLVLKPNEVASVVGYVLSLRGTHPVNPKAPQGARDDSTSTSAIGGAAPAPTGRVSSGSAGATQATNVR
jgi:cytochrome c oxidase cbb3-type subunit 3